MKIVPLESSHLEEAAAAVAARYAALRAHVPDLPARYEDAGAFLPLLGDLAAAAPGVAALQDGRLTGFLTAHLVPSWHGQRMVYSPEWANAAEDRRVCEAMYAVLAATWAADGYLHHCLTLFEHNRPGAEAWQWLGFAYHVVDALRTLESPAGGAGDVAIRRAGPEDLDVVAAMGRRLQRHLASAPTFLPDDRVQGSEEWRACLDDPATAVWLAERDGEAVGTLKIGPASRDACTIIRDEGTASITGAFTTEGARGAGVSTALLAHGLAWAREQGRVRCAVDFEAANVLARRYWLRHFRPVCLSFCRHLIESRP